MKKLAKKIGCAFAVALAAVGMCVSLASCGDTKPELIDTYYSYTYLKQIKSMDSTDYYISQTFTVALYSDNTYTCQIDITELTENSEDYGKEEVNVIGHGSNDGPVACMVCITRTGNYTLTTDGLSVFTLELSEADRIIYATNAVGAHHSMVPTDDNGDINYLDSNNAEQTAAFDTKWFGKWEDFDNLVGAKVTLTGDAVSHIFDAGSVMFEYKTPMFALAFQRPDIW